MRVRIDCLQEQSLSRRDEEDFLVYTASMPMMHLTVTFPKEENIPGQSAKISFHMHAWSMPPPSPFSLRTIISAVQQSSITFQSLRSLRNAEIVRSRPECWMLSGDFRGAQFSSWFRMQWPNLLRSFGIISHIAISWRLEWPLYPEILTWANIEKHDTVLA